METDKRPTIGTIPVYMSKLSTQTKIILSVTLVIIGVAGRLLPHAWNFTPLVAIALFAGAYMGQRYAIALTIAAMLIGDIFLGFYAWQVMLSVYGGFIIAGFLGLWVRKRKNPEVLMAASISASVIFFIVTNFAVWAFGSLYAKTPDGLMQAYTLAIPFFRNMLVGDIFYSFVLFGAYELVLRAVRAKQTRSILPSKQGRA